MVTKRTISNGKRVIWLRRSPDTITEALMTLLKKVKDLEQIEIQEYPGKKHLLTIRFDITNLYIILLLISLRLIEAGRKTVTKMSILQ